MCNSCNCRFRSSSVSVLGPCCVSASSHVSGSGFGSDPIRIFWSLLVLLVLVCDPDPGSGFGSGSLFGAGAGSGLLWLCFMRRNRALA